jgi:secreted PhoX family phosphatase
MNSESPSRRKFIKTGLLTAGGIGLGLAGLHKYGQKGAVPGVHESLGPLFPTPDQTTGIHILKLPAGFRYHTFGWAGQTMSDGIPTPQSMDGMGLIQSESGVHTLVRNHELRGSSGAFGDPETAWDVNGGGTTNLLFDTNSEKLVQDFVSLNGTMNNCGGGTTPWGTWLSCEEAMFSPEFAHFGIQTRQARWDVLGSRKDHGYVFEVGPEGEANPEPIREMGQFWHEAATVDPQSGIVYMTEDRSPHAGLYRFIPDIPGKLKSGGRLQMLKVHGVKELIVDVAVFSPMQISWVDIAEPGRGNTPGTHDGKGVVSQGLEAGGSAFRALEGCIWSENQLFFTSKNSGAAKAGYIFRLDLARSILELVYEAPGKGGFSGPDNINVSPGGKLIICEDREDGDMAAQYLAELSSEGDLSALAQVNPALTGNIFGHQLEKTALTAEWAGVCFSPDGQWMFANVYRPGFTCAITGPWSGGSF